MANAETAARNREHFESLLILDNKNYKQVYEAIKTGELPKDVVVRVPPDYNYLLSCHDFGKIIASDDSTLRARQSLSIFHVSIGLDDQAMVDQLLALNVDLHATTKGVQAPLRFAIEGNKLTIVEKLIAAGVDVNGYGPDEYLPLTIAILDQRYEMAKLLIRHGAEINVTECRGALSPLCLAASIENGVNFMELLIKHGADVNLIVTQPNTRWITTPLMRACQTGTRKAIEFLINLPNIDITKVNNRNENCLFWSVYTPPAMGLELILSTNIDLNTRNIDNNLPLHYEPDFRLNNFLQNYTIKRHLIKLMVAGFYICQEYRDILKKDTETGPIQAECSKEVQLMMNTYESSINWSFFRILRTSQHLLSLRFKHIQVPAGKEEEWIEKFPIYGSMLAFHLKKALQRKMLLQQAEGTLFDLFYKLLPATFINDMFYYLTNYDLYQLIEKNYKQVCEAIKTGELSKDVVVTVPCYYYYLLNSHDFGKIVTLDDSNPADRRSLSILHVCIGLDDQAMVDKLLALKVNLQTTTEDVRAPLCFAVEGNKMTIVEKLIAAGADVNDNGLDEYLPLTLAILDQRYELTELLIRHGADVNVRECPGALSPLCLAASIENGVNFMELLIKHGADVNLEVTEPNTRRTTTPLMRACQTDARKAIEFLINLPNIDITKVNNRNENCLFLTVNAPHAVGLELILSTNIDVNTRNIDNNLPLHYESDFRLNNFLQNYTIKRHLIKLMVAGFYICQEYRDILKKDAETGQIQDECSKEVQSMMNTYESSINWSCFKIFRTSQHLLSLRFKYIHVPAGKEEVLIERFPIYGSMLAFHLKKALQRKMLLQQAEETLLDIFYKLLPATFIYDMLYYLRNSDLYQLIE
ncbi:Similar to ANK2: Ankyrin-2 (Homo sapiens) [Cotesia congregata]|uniref:Similar to ANK2: Ankyrin-2 (Homo sapiens) n=1 Tax=Cotesia congregata TaxID=51543 RepID=A0A8J2E9L1_COTCN|nr:Similar to ANK2: Ankyrin-2 (Homo sapiens) [Cotesia congregata]